MKRIRIISFFTFFIAISMISTGVFMMNVDSKSFTVESDVSGLDVKNMATNANMIVKEPENIIEEETVPPLLEEVEMETLPASIVIPPREEVYEGMTLEELGAKLNQFLGDETVSGMGEFIASESLSKGVDPYITLAIILQETGCGNHCSNLAKVCYNFGGVKGSPGCNGGSFKQYESVEAGLAGLIDVLDRNYFSLGLNTPETIGPKYCEGDEWAGHVSWFVNKIRNS